MTSLLAGCGGTTLIFTPPPPDSDETTVVIVAVPETGRPIARLYEHPLSFEGEPDRTYTLYALYYGCDAEGVGTIEPLTSLPRPYRTLRTIAGEGTAWEETEAPAFVDPSPLCPTLTIKSVSVPGTARNLLQISAAVVGDTVFVIARDEGVFRVTRDRAIPTDELDGLPLAGIATIDGDLVLLGDGRSVRVGSSTTVVDLMNHEGHEAVITGGGTERFAILRTETGSAAFERFDDRWTPVECGELRYPIAPKPSVTITDDDTFVVLPTDLTAKQRGSLRGSILSITQDGCETIEAPRPLVSAGAHVPGVGRVVAAYGESIDRAVVNDVFIQDGQSWRQLDMPKDESGSVRGALSTVTRSPKGFAFATHFNQVGEWSEANGFCFLEARLANIPLQIIPTVDGYVVISKGDYDPDGIDWCESLSGCVDVQVNFIDRAEHPAIECGLLP